MIFRGAVVFSPSLLAWVPDTLKPPFSNAALSIGVLKLWALRCKNKLGIEKYSGTSGSSYIGSF